MKTIKKNVRETALDILEGIEKNQSYSNLMLNNKIKKNELEQKDIPLLTELTYGTIQRKITLDYFLAPFISWKEKDRKLGCAVIKINDLPNGLFGQNPGSSSYF